MKLLSYKVINITDGDDYHVEFTFDTGKETQVIEFPHIQDRQEFTTDEEGNSIPVIDEQTGKMLVTPASEVLHEAILAYSLAYIAGKAQEEKQKAAHESASALIGQERSV